MERNNGYKASVKESSKELTAREKLMMCDTSNAISLDTAIDDATDSPLVFAPSAYAVIGIHNERVKQKDGETPRKDYDVYVVMDADGNKYVTSSSSFFNSFIDIWDTMGGTDHEPYEIEVYKQESKNYKGKSFITCSII